jgi:UTP--glucose-1-phosphate uridylyltransferase
MIDLYYKCKSTVIALERVPKAEVNRYGIISGETISDNVYKIEKLVEKPEAADAPSDIAIIGRYILTPGIFEIFEKMTPGKGGEYQLTDALNMLLEKESIYGFLFEGKRYDAGDKTGFLKATIELALKSENIAPDFRDYLAQISDRCRDV